MKPRDVTGQRFGKLVAIQRVLKKNSWLCQCDCGNRKPIYTSDLYAGKVTSCGCAYRSGQKRLPQNARFIREDHLNGITIQSLAKKYHVQKRVISDVLRWRICRTDGKELIEVEPGIWIPIETEKSKAEKAKMTAYDGESLRDEPHNITPEIVYRIRELAGKKPRLTYSQIADEVGVSPSLVSRVSKGGSVVYWCGRSQ